MLSVNLLWMSVLLLERLSAILAFWALRELSMSSPVTTSDITDACDRLLWDELQTLTERLSKGTLGNEHNNMSEG